MKRNDTGPKPASWPPNPALPEPTRAHAQSTAAFESLGLPANGAVCKAEGKRPWRQVGQPGTFAQHPISEALDRKESAYRKLLSSLHQKGVKNPSSAIRGGAAKRQNAQSMHSRIQFYLASLRATVKGAKLVTEVMRRCNACGMYPSRSVVQRVRRALDKNEDG